MLLFCLRHAAGETRCVCVYMCVCLVGSLSGAQVAEGGRGGGGGGGERGTMENWLPSFITYAGYHFTPS